MIRNGRKLQILRLLTDNALSAAEIADVSKISPKSAAMCVLRYRRQGLIAAKIGGEFFTTDRGEKRIAWIEKQSVFGGTPLSNSMNGHRNIDSNDDALRAGNALQRLTTRTSLVHRVVVD